MHFAQHLNTIPQDINKDVIDYIWQQHQIWEQYQNSDFLQPDRHHPNRHAHKIIFDALVNKYNL
jgi:lysophospholipase L1-like esterase